MQAKALAEKNERDMNVQREQAERDVSTPIMIHEPIFLLLASSKQHVIQSPYIFIHYAVPWLPVSEVCYCPIRCLLLAANGYLLTSNCDVC